MSTPRFVSFGLARYQGYFEYLNKVILDVTYSNKLNVILPICISNLVSKRIYVKAVPQNTNYAIDNPFLGYVDPDQSKTFNVVLTREPPSTFPFEEEIAVLVEGYEDDQYTQKLGDTLIDFEAVIVSRTSMDPAKKFDFSDGTTQGITVVSSSYASLDVTANHYTSPPYGLTIKMKEFGTGSITIKVPLSDLEPRRYIIVLDVKRLAYGDAHITKLVFKQKVPNLEKELFVIDDKYINNVLPIGKWRTIGFAIAPVDGELGDLHIYAVKNLVRAGSESYSDILVLDDIYIFPY